MNHSFNINDYWDERAAIRDDPTSVRVGGVQYILGPETRDDELSKAGFRGYYGDSFYIRFDDGRLVHSTNLWRNGEIPESHREALPDNARFLTSEEFKRQVENGYESPKEAKAPAMQEDRRSILESRLRDAEVLKEDPGRDPKGLDRD